MNTLKGSPTVEEKLRAFALLSRCQAQLAYELSRLLPETLTAPGPEVDRGRPGRRARPK